MGLRLISIPTVGGIDICKSQFGNPQERSIYYQYKLFVRSIVFHLRQLSRLDSNERKTEAKLKRRQT